jgi:succinate dehydrogenase / fumarate reductase flavoprotein subunit
MYHQFMELAGVDITREPMEVGPTCHYQMGGVRVDAETTQTTVPGLFAAGEVAAGLHGANRLGGNSLSDLVVFGRRSGLYAAEYAKAHPGTPTVDGGEVEQSVAEMLAPFDCQGGENPYSIHADLEDLMQDLVGIIRVERELLEALDGLAKLRERLGRASVIGNRQYNPGWHLALDLHNLLTVAEAVTRSAIERKESRGGHARDDYPGTDPTFGKVNVVTRLKDGEMVVCQEPLPEMPPDLKKLVEEGA